MRTQNLFNNKNQLIGKIITLPNGKLELRAPSNKLKGVYDPKTNQTRDPSNRLIGNGNLLASLL